MTRKPSSAPELPALTNRAIWAVDFSVELSEVTWLDGRPLWYPYQTSPDSAPKSPHTRHGTSGIGSVLIRLYRTTMNEQYLRWADLCAYCVSSRYTNKLWQDFGPAGHGEFLIDMYLATGDERYLNNAYYLAEAILPHAMECEGGIAFPGMELLKISCDWGLGTAGVAGFLDRLACPTKTRLLFPDSLLTERSDNGLTPSGQQTCE